MVGAGREAKAGVSAWGSVFNLSCSAIGAGVLSFPYAFQLTGKHMRYTCLQVPQLLVPRVLVTHLNG